jgi:hypothetical protein
VRLWFLDIATAPHSPDARRIESVADHVDRFGFTMCDAVADEIVTDQKGVFRTNCLDWSVRVSTTYHTPHIEFLGVSIEQTSCKTFYHERPWRSTSNWFDASGCSRAPFGQITGNCGPKMGMPCRESMQERAPLTPALREPGNELWLACCPTPQRVSLVHTSITSKTRTNKLLSICFWYVVLLTPLRTFLKKFSTG